MKFQKISRSLAKKNNELEEESISNSDSNLLFDFEDLARLSKSDNVSRFEWEDCDTENDYTDTDI